MHFTLADLTADITQNGAESGADTLELELRETLEPLSGGPGLGKGEFRFVVKDNGKGMSGSGLDRAVDPFVTDGVKHPGRRVGLGLPFLIQTAIQSGGGWRIVSAKNGGLAERGSVPGEGGGLEAGTVVEAWFDLANVDTPPLGDIPGLFRSVLLFEGPKEIVLRRVRRGDRAGIHALDYEVRKTELEEVLGGLEDASSLALLGKYLRSLEEDE